jgi:adenine specific DNA methylase Mod
MTKEQEFYKALRDIFVGAKVEGESGYINLMRIKSRYYEKGVFPKLQKDIEQALEPFPKFREELFDKLYTFFHRYFSESGSIYFRHTPIHQNVYEKVYTDDKDVILFWKTHMLYYVKTDRLFKNLEAEIDGFKFFFDVSTLEHKRANEKREIVYEFKERRNDGVLVFNVYYSEKGKKTRTDEILKALRKEGIRITQDTLENAFRVFEKQSEVDYFINQNAKEFLKEQFDIWLYQYVFSGESQWTEDRIKQLQVLKDIASKIIDFISQFEDELVRIWNKPKFVKNSNYVITLDRILSACHCEERSDEAISLVEKIKKHKNFSLQVKEWEELGIDKDNPKAPIDTKYFKDLELEILSQFDDLDKSLDGWLIKSENYQALNTILPKFKEKVQTIYIDPPFNLDSSDQFLYRTNYKDANWATLLENRLKLAKDILNEKGSIFLRCDYNGNWIVRCLMDDIFDRLNFRNELIINKSNKQGAIDKRFNPATETLFLYSKIEESSINPQFKRREKQSGWLEMHSPKENKNSHSVIFNGITYIAPKGRHWSFAQDTVDQLSSENRIRVIKKQYIDVYGNKQEKVLEYLMSENETIESDWTDIPGYSTTTGFQTENSEKLLARVINTGSQSKDLIFDFFLGSGTTTAVAHKLGRRWLGVEMGEHFYTVVLPRMKKVLAYDKSGISKEKDVKEEYNQNKAGGFFKYYELEQYEDTLRRVKYEDSDLFDNPYEDPYSQYVFMRDLKMLEVLEIDYENNKVEVDLSKLYEHIDVPETLSNLCGKWIKKIAPTLVEFEDGEKIDTNNLDYKLIKPLIWW